MDGSVRVRAGDRQGRENISRYLIRAPFSVDKIQYSCRERSVIYRTKMIKGPNRNFQVYDPSTFWPPSQPISLTEESTSS